MKMFDAPYLRNQTGTMITPISAQTDKGITYIEDIEEFVALFIVEKPGAGTWTIGCDNLSENSVKFGILAPQPVPVTTFSKMQKSGTKINISLTVSPLSDNTTVAVYYTPTPDNGTGFVIGEAQKASSENLTFVWNTQDIPSGTYYLYAETDDGKNPPVRTFCDNPITVSTGGLQPPTNLQGWREGANVTLTWTPSVSEAVIGYYVQYTDDPTGLGYKYVQEALSADNATITGIDSAKDYKFCVVAFDAEGNKSVESQPWETTRNTDNASLCLAAKLLGNDSQHVKYLRQFRDAVLNENIHGTMLTGLYYHHASELTNLIISNKTLREKAEDTLRMLMPCVKEALAGNDFVLSQQELQAVLRLWSYIEPTASKNLKTDVQTVLTKHVNGNELRIRRGESQLKTRNEVRNFK